MAASSFLHQRQPFLSNPFRVRPSTTSITDYTSKSQSFSLFSRAGFLTLLCLMIVLGVFSPWINGSSTFFRTGKQKLSQIKPNQTDSVSLTPEMELSKWRDYTLAEAAKFVAKNNTVIMCAVSQPYLPFLNNWLISIARQRHQDQVLVIAEDYATLYIVNKKWPGHAVLVPPAPDAQIAHKFGSEGFFNFTSRRPRHLLHILELGFNVMYNDVDMVWLADPFPYLQGQHDVYFTDDMKDVKPLHHSSHLPPPGKKGRTYICSCMIFLRPTNGAKQVMKKWIEELEGQSWSKEAKLNDQPAFNWALNKTVGQAELYLLPQVAFPSGGLYFKNQTWVQETKGQHVIIHNNYVVGFDRKIKRFHDFGLWLVDDHALESPLGRL